MTRLKRKRKRETAGAFPALKKDDPDKFTILEKLTITVNRWVSGSQALALTSLFLVIWALAGPFMNFNETWNLIIATTSASVTFFMIFVLARAQAKDTTAIQLKLNEIIAVLKGANNNLINLEGMSEKKIAEIADVYETLGKSLHESPETSIESIIPHQAAEEILEKQEITFTTVSRKAGKEKKRPLPDP